MVEHNKPSSIEELCASPDSVLNEADIAVMNLLAAGGLPGSEKLALPECLATLDRWTDPVRRYSANALKTTPAEEVSGESGGVNRFLAMVTLLKHPRGLGIEYQPTAIGNFVYADSRDDFIHGLLSRRLGTCASIPVLLVAIGRRLGYPMHLALVKRHFICQWVEDGIRLNLEGSCPGGGEVYPDERYHRLPYPMSAEEIRSGRFLRPLTAQETLSEFLAIRGHCLADNGRTEEAVEAYEAAGRVAPGWSQFKDYIAFLPYRQNRLRTGRQ